MVVAHANSYISVCWTGDFSALSPVLTLPVPPMKYLRITIGILLCGALAACAGTSTNAEETASPTEQTGIPVHFRWERLGIEASIEQVGITPEGDMASPVAWENVGWYKEGPRPSEPGNAVIDGHLDSYTDTAVFWRVKEAVPGDIFEVTDDTGATHRFSVTEIKKMLPGDAEAERETFIASDDGAHLNLVTCSGTWDDTLKMYNERLVVFADLIKSDEVTK